MTTKKAANATDTDTQAAQAQTDPQATDTDTALAGADTAGAGAVPAVASTPADAPPDPYAGLGGLYQVRDGQIVQLEATRHPDA